MTPDAALVARMREAHVPWEADPTLCLSCALDAADWPCATSLLLDALAASDAALLDVWANGRKASDDTKDAIAAARARQDGP